MRILKIEQVNGAVLMDLDGANGYIKLVHPAPDISLSGSEDGMVEVVFELLLPSDEFFTYYKAKLETILYVAERATKVGKGYRFLTFARRPDDHVARAVILKGSLRLVDENAFHYSGNSRVKALLSLTLTNITTKEEYTLIDDNTSKPLIGAEYVIDNPSQLPSQLVLLVAQTNNWLKRQFYGGFLTGYRSVDLTGFKPIWKFSDASSLGTGVTKAADGTYTTYGSTVVKKDMSATSGLFSICNILDSDVGATALHHTGNFILIIRYRLTDSSGLFRFRIGMPYPFDPANSNVDLFYDYIINPGVVGYQTLVTSPISFPPGHELGLDLFDGAGVKIMLEKLAGTGSIHLDTITWIPADVGFSGKGNIAVSSNISNLAMAHTPDGKLYGSVWGGGETSAVSVNNDPLLIPTGRSKLVVFATFENNNGNEQYVAAEKFNLVRLRARHFFISTNTNPIVFSLTDV